MENFALLDCINFVGNKAKSGYCDIGDCHYNLGDFKAALRFHQRYLDAVKTEGDRAGEARAYGSLGKDYHSLGRFKKAEECYQKQLRIAREVGDRAEEGRAYGNFGTAKGIHLKKLETYNQSALAIANEEQDAALKGTAHGNLGKICISLHKWKDALEHFNQCVRISRESGDRAAEGRAYDNLAHVYSAQGNLEQAIEYQNSLSFSQKQGDDAEQGNAYYGLGCSYESLGSLDEALQCYESSLKKFNAIRDRRQPKDEWKINLRNEYHLVNIALWGILIKQKKIDEALLAAEKGRAEALIDLLENKRWLPRCRKYQNSNQTPYSCQLEEKRSISG